jgi:hypothetical protein
LTRYALKTNEHKQQGGNLARAIYSAYNGGPSQLTRYWGEQNPELKKVDEAFWETFPNRQLRSRVGSSALLPEINVSTPMECRRREFLPRSFQSRG